MQINYVRYPGVVVKRLGPRQYRIRLIVHLHAAPAGAVVLFCIPIVIARRRLRRRGNPVIITQKNPAVWRGNYFWRRILSIISVNKTYACCSAAARHTGDDGYQLSVKLRCV